jgi:small GTP-binding protein
MIVNALPSKTLKISRKDFTDELAFQIPWNILITLTRIDLRNCSLNVIPIGISKLDPNILTSLRLDGNPLVGFHKTLVDSKASPKDIIMHLQESLKGGHFSCKEMKVMVVGEPAVGKTAMLKILYGTSLRELAAHPCVATDGIDLGEITLEGYRLMFWDFAGQEVYRHSHQLFLSDNAVCLVMFRLTTADEEARQQLTYWMDSLLQRAPNATCLLIGTCARFFPEEVAESRLRRRWADLRERYGKRIFNAVAIDSVEDFGFSALRREIVRMCREQVV